MSLLSTEDQQFLRDKFAEEMESEVTLHFFTQKESKLILPQGMECQYCKEAGQIVDEIASLSDKIKVEKYDFAEDKEKASEYRVDKIPAILIEGRAKGKVRLFGLPSGYEFVSLIEDIIDVSTGKTSLSEEARTSLSEITKPVHIQVFVTPTCPYCSSAVRLAHQIAVESELVTADMIESIEFPYLANRYAVRGVPKTVINEITSLEGAAPEQMVMEQLIKAVGE